MCIFFFFFSFTVTNKSQTPERSRFSTRGGTLGRRCGAYIWKMAWLVSSGVLLWNNSTIYMYVFFFFNLLGSVVPCSEDFLSLVWFCQCCYLWSAATSSGSWNCSSQTSPCSIRNPRRPVWRMYRSTRASPGPRDRFTNLLSTLLLIWWATVLFTVHAITMYDTVALHCSNIYKYIYIY